MKSKLMPACGNCGHVMTYLDKPCDCENHFGLPIKREAQAKEWGTITPLEKFIAVYEPNNLTDGLAFRRLLKMALDSEVPKVAYAFRVHNPETDEVTTHLTRSHDVARRHDQFPEEFNMLPHDCRTHLNAARDAFEQLGVVSTALDGDDDLADSCDPAGKADASYYAHEVAAMDRAQSLIAEVYGEKS